MTDRPDLPWVLLRKGRPPVRFRTRDLGQRFYNGLIFGRDGWKEPEGGLHGPGGESWYRNGRHGEWRRDDDRRKRDPLPADEETGAK